MQTPRRYTTNEAAAVVRYRPQTIRRDLCLNGHFKGIRPVKLPGGRLLWPAEEIDRLASGGSVEAAQ
jgi:hypothetical protein